MKPEPIFNSSRRMSESPLRRVSASVSKSPSRKRPGQVVDFPESEPEAFSTPTSRKRPARVVDFPEPEPEAFSTPTSRKRPARVVDFSSSMSAHLSASSARLVETGSVAIPVAKEQNTGNLYPVKAVQRKYLGMDAQSHAPTTESLTLVLHTTMSPTTGRRPIVIPGVGKRGNRTQVGEVSRSRHLFPILQSGILLLTLIAFTLFSLFSLSPLVDGYAKFPMIGEAIQWVHTGPTNWSLLIGDHAPAAQIDPTPQANDTEPLFLPASDYVAIARQAAASAGIPQDYFVRQINQESGFNPNARSPAGAVGIAQFEPSTAAGLGINPYDPIASLYGAARYMARLDNSYGGDYAKALAAYNAGPPAVTRAVNSGGANWLAYMPAETQRYVHAIMG